MFVILTSSSKEEKVYSSNVVNHRNFLSLSSRGPIRKTSASSASRVYSIEGRIGIIVNITP